jgi:hypothetical protein
MSDVKADGKASGGGATAAIPPLDPTATALFAACETAWDDDTRHDKFVKYCSSAGLLATAARQYRLRLDRNPEDAMAGKMQQRIVTMASLLLATHQPPPQPLTRSRWFLLLVAVAAFAGVLAAILHRR